MVDNWDPSLLVRHPKTGNNAKYDLTPFGQFVKALWEYDNHGVYEEPLTAFATTLVVSEDIVEAALDQVEQTGN